MPGTALDIRDTILQSTVPTIMVPKFGELVPLQENGHRFLSTSDGLWIEIRRPWIHLVLPAATQDTYAMPYGNLQKKVELTMGKVPRELVDRFIEDARREAPLECAAWIVWNETTGEFDYRWLEPLEQGPAHVKFTRPTLSANEHLIIDLHSHGHIGACFSPEDDQDDRDEVKIAYVLGSFDKPEITFKARLCTMGGYLPLRHPAVITVE